MKNWNRSVVMFVACLMVTVVVESAGAAVPIFDTGPFTVNVTNNTGARLHVFIEVGQGRGEYVWKEDGQTESKTTQGILSCPKYVVARTTKGSGDETDQMVIRCLDDDGGDHYDKCGWYACKNSDWSVTKDSSGRLQIN